MVKRIGILTSGGDSPGMNAAIRAVTRVGLNSGLEVFGIYNGYKGMVEGYIEPLTRETVGDIVNRGGTILGSARLPEFKDIEVRKKAIAQLKKRGIEAVVVIGGDGSYRGALSLTEMGINCIGLPGTIDNDITCTDYTIGFQTALETVVECVDKLRDTSNSHHRCSIVEVMGNRCGDLALWSGIACGAEIVVTSDTGFDEQDVLDRLRDIDIIKNQLKICPTGLFIITGPTGSGKTTTLHAQIGEVVKNADYEKIVVTIEDPVEIYNPNYCQVQIHETEDNATNFSSQKALQVILRQDPEIILYNEIRNKTDAETVIQAGATGHQVFTTLHANDCITAISRLLDLGVSKVSLLNQVNLISSQRLIGILCPHCQREYKLSESDKILLSKEEYNRLSTIDLKQVGTVEQRNNCPHCNHTGYINRIAIVEYVLFNDDLKDILYHTSSMKEIKEALKKNKFISMWEKGLDYVVAGKTSLIELYNQVGNKDAINNLINNL